MNYNVDSVAGLAHELREQFSSVSSLCVVFVGRKFKVYANCDAMIEKLRAYFRDFLEDSNAVVGRGCKSPCDLADVGATEIFVYETESAHVDADWKPVVRERSKKGLKEEMSDLADGRLVRKVRTGMFFAFGGKHHIAVGPCLKNDNQVINFLNNRLLGQLLDDGGLLLHAAGAVRGGDGLAFTGISGAGKSTIALHLLEDGWDFLSNDRLVITQDGGQVVGTGVPKLPRVNPGTMLSIPSLTQLLHEEKQAQYAAMTKEQLWTVEDKYDVPIGDCFPGCVFRLQAPIRGLVVLSWSVGRGRAEFERTSLREASWLLPAISKQPGAFYLPRSGGFFGKDDADYFDVLGDFPLLHFKGGVDFDFAKKICDEFVLSAKTQN